MLDRQTDRQETGQADENGPFALLAQTTIRRVALVQAPAHPTIVGHLVKQKNTDSEAKSELEGHLGPILIRSPRCHPFLKNTLGFWDFLLHLAFILTIIIIIKQTKLQLNIPQTFSQLNLLRTSCCLSLSLLSPSNQPAIYPSILKRAPQASYLSPNSHLLPA